MPDAASIFRPYPKRPPKPRPPEQLLYHCPAWRKARAQHLAANPWCVSCAKAGQQVKANTVDHVRRTVEISGCSGPRATGRAFAIRARL